MLTVIFVEILEDFNNHVSNESQNERLIDLAEKECVLFGPLNMIGGAV